MWIKHTGKHQGAGFHDSLVLEHTVWHTFSKKHWDPFSCVYEQKEAWGELCVLRLVTE